MSAETSSATPSSANRVIAVYLTANGLFTLAASIIWAINTLFLMGPGGLDIFQVMLVNTAYVVGQMLFEVPTGVVADTIGRTWSFLIGIATLLVSTVLYVLTPQMGWGIPGFVVAGVLIGLGYCFQTGAVDAWMVDALDATEWRSRDGSVGEFGAKDRAFAWGQQAFGVATLIGTPLGGFLGQLNLTLPYLVRAALLLVTLGFVAVFMRDIGFKTRPLHLSNFGSETRVIFQDGVRYGLHNPVVRLLLFVAFSSGLFFLFGFYAWQRYILDLLGREYVWVNGVIQAGFAVAGIIGNAWVSRASRRSAEWRPVRVLTATAVVSAVLVAAIGALGLLGLDPGWLPFSIAVGLWLAFGLTFGVQGPVARSFINAHIPSAQRATVLSVEALFADAGGAVGQPALGAVAQRLGLPIAYVLGAVPLAATAPLYAAAGRAAHAQGEAAADSTEADAG